MDVYNKELKHVIYGERNLVDSEGFQYKYIRKESLQEEHISPNIKGKNRKQSNANEKYIYIKKSPGSTKEMPEQPKNTMA